MTDAVLLVAHGSVARLEELPGFLTRIRRGRPPEDALLEEMTHRYAAIGGSPLVETTRIQADLLSARLGLPVHVGMRFSEPSLQSALVAARDRERLLILPVAPFSVHVYDAVVRQTAAALHQEQPTLPMSELLSVAPWGLQTEFVECLAQAIAPSLALEGELLLTAHSLPQSVIDGGDPYAEQVSALAEALMLRLGRRATLAYQSQGASGGRWLGPDLRTVLEDKARAGVRRVVVAPIGFVTEHVETLFDLDVEAAGWARELGVIWQRIPVPGTNSGFISALETVARHGLMERE
jgi:ferrochelatase